MSAVLERDVVSPIAAVQPKSAVRTVRVGLVGLGRVGQAVARLAPEAQRLRVAGYRVRVVGALVRDVSKRRRCPRLARITSNAAAFLRGDYDVVVEALGTVQPARSIVSRLLGRGIPVVTANKELVAAHGPELVALAKQRRTTIRYEACALAGVPFLGALAARPLVSDVNELTAVVNGTSNFILSKLEAEQCAFDAALEQAQALGLTEPDSSRDLDGIDAADKLALLASVIGWGTLPRHQLRPQGIRALTAADLAAARSFDRTIKPVAFATRIGTAVSAFVGPAALPLSNPLASLHGTLNGIRLHGTFVGDLFFSGPGAGPDITAATILDDVVESVATTPTARVATPPVTPISPLVAPPPTGWLIRATFPGFVPDAAALTRLFDAHDLHATRISEPIDRSRWLLVAPIGHEALSPALACIDATHRIQTHAIRSL
jgi:homoserine dehydrogenase